MEKILVLLIVSFSLLTANEASCLNSYKECSISITEQRKCCKLLASKGLDIESRSKNGWIRFLDKTALFNDQDKSDLKKCVDVYFSTFSEVRVGGTLR